MNVIDGMRIFKRLSERQSFSGVASEMGVTQPTVSKVISNLEKHLGVQLFRRSSRGLTLTGEGQQLLVLGTPLIEQFDSVVASVKDEKQLLRGQLKMASPLAFARHILTPLFEDFSKQHPDLRLNLVLSDGDVDLIEEGIDLAIRHGEQTDSSLRILKIGSWKRAVYASPSYIRKFGRPSSLEALKDHRLLYYRCYGERPMWGFEGPTGRSTQIVFEPYLRCDNSDFIRDAVIQGMGLSLLPEWMMVKLERSRKIVKLFEKECTEVVPVYVASTRTREMTAKQRAMTDFLTNRFSECSCLSLTKEAVSGSCPTPE